MKLRNYQQAAVEAVFESWKSNRSVLVSMATGLGKTVVLSAIIQRLLRESPGRRAMVLAHRSELIEQGQATIHRLTGADVQMEMADCRVVPMFGREPEVVVSTIQTQTAGEDGHERMRRFDPAGFGCVIVDECHHAVSQSYRDCLGWYRRNPDLRVLGLTATPDRGARAAAFPMRNARGLVTGIRYRELGTGRKWSMRGSHDGLFLPRDGGGGEGPLVVCEGASDTAAALTLGWRGVGRSSCQCGGRLLADYILAEGVHEVAIFADNDPAGRHGATALKKFLEDALMFRMPFIANIYWPSPQFKDLRAALAEKSSLPIFGKTPLVEV